MFTSALVSWLHLVGVALGLGSVAARGVYLRVAPLTDDARDRALAIDGVWGLSALLLLPTGLFRAFGGLEKGTDFYAHSALFWMKLTLVVTLIALEVWPMAVLIRWRIALARKQPIDTSRARTFAIISFVEAGAIIVIMACAAFMARGFLQVR